MKKMSIYVAILSSFFALSSRIYAQNCGGNFTQYQVLSRNNGENFRQFADINSDGLTDLITQDNSTVARFYLNTGTGYIAAGSLQLPSFGNVVAAKDFDNDGRVDLLSNSITGTNCLSNQIRIFWNTGQNNAFFSAGLSTNLPLPVNPYCMQSQDIDFNGDGLLDIIATSMPFSPSTNSPGRTYLNNGNRNFSVAADFLWPRDLYGTHTRDFNGDGNADFLVTIKDGWADGLRGMYYYRGNGNGTFQAPIVNFNSAPLAAGGIPIQADPLNNSSEDVLMSLNGVSPATIKLGRWNGSNNFAFNDISIPSGFSTSQSFDFDLDGKQDIMILSLNGQNTLSWMTGNGNGTYTSNASNILQSNEHNLGTLFKDANSNTQYISGSNPNTLIVYRRNVAQTSFITENITACGSYNWNGNSYTQSGSYNETLFTNVNGCDSIVSTLNLTIIAETPQPPTACYQTATFNNQTCSWDVTGSPAPAIETNASACGSYTWEVNGQSYTASGNFTFSQNCQDYSLNLTINQATTSSVIASITQGETYNFNGQNLTAAGTYTATLQNAAGCDSVVTLNLSVGTSFTCGITSPNTEICNGDVVNLLATTNALGNTKCQSDQLPSNLQNGLIAYYPFCGNANDASGNNNHGTVFSAELAPDRFNIPNSAYYFNGSTSHIKTSNYFETTTNMSISFWCKKTAGTGVGTILTDGSVNFSGADFLINTDGLRIGIRADKSGNLNYEYSSPPQLSSLSIEDNWVHIVWVLENGISKIYFNGNLIAEINEMGSNEGYHDPYVTIGARNVWSSMDDFFNGYIDDIATYNRALNTDEIQALYNSESLSILWSTGETTPNISVSPSETTTYNVTVTQGTQTCTNEVTITVNQPSSETVNASITEGETYNFNGQNLAAAGTYTATLQNVAGCDSLVTLNLTVEPAVNQINCNINSSDSEICLGENVTLSMEVSGQSSSQLLNTNEFNVVGTFNGKTYLVTNNSMTWNDAKAYAENLNFSGSSLAVFETLEENNEVYALTNQYSEWLWIGLFQDLSSPQYSEPNGGWTWVNGDPINYSNFQPGEPSNGLSIENHGQLRRYPNGKWNDIDANVATKAIIEIDEIQNESYLWNTGETTQTISITPSSSSTYSCVYTLGTQTCTNEVTITVNQPSSETVNASITEGETYNFNGQNLTAAGTYTATLQNAAGCDSVVTLNLTVNPAPVAGCYATSVMNFVQGQRADATNVTAIRSNAELALGMPEPVVTNVVNFVSLGFGGSITLAFEAPIANGEGNDILINEATWGNNSCNNYPETADVFASQDGVNFIYLSRVCQDAELDLGALSWAQYIRIVDVSNQMSFNADADGFDINGITCLNGAATSLPDDGLVACSLQEIVSYTPENRKNGTAVAAPRNNPANALGTPQNNNTINFTALGFGGTMVGKFDFVVFNQPGNDLRVTETSFGNPSCNNYPEKAIVSVSMDNVNWTELGEICQDGEFDLANVNYAQYIKIQDASPVSSNKFNGAADGYDVDAVVVLNNGCGTSSARLAQMDNTTTPDASLVISAFPNPMEDYTIVNFEGLENDSDFNFQIMDAAGRVIRNNNIRVATANPTYLFEASELARGIYQVIIANDNGSQIIRLVK